MTDNPLMNLGDLTKPATVLIEKISDALGGVLHSRVKPERFPFKVTSSHRLSQGLLGWNARLSRRSPLVRSPSLRHSDSTVKVQLEEFPLGSSSGLSWTFQLTSQFRSSFFAATTSSRSE
jgi:hypothetical protein